MSIRNPNCTLCPLHEHANHVCLVGNGPPNAKILCVGEAPGATEEEQQKPFVGAAGKLLDRSLREIAGIKREDVYVSNVVKCRPEFNATPDLKDIKTCVENYLIPEIEAVRPEWILVLGNSAMRGVMKKSGITKSNGEIKQLNFAVNGETFTAKAFPTVHPAAVLRSPMYAEMFGSDLKRFGALVRGEAKSPKTVVKVVRNAAQFTWLLNKIEEAKELSWDLETYTVPVEEPYIHTGLQEWWSEDSKIVSIAFTWQEGLSVVLPVHHEHTPWKNPDHVLARLCAVMQGGKFYSEGHNIKYDCKWMHEKGIKVHQNFCTMIAGHMLDENRSKSLKNLSRTVLHTEAYDVGAEIKDAYHMPLNRLCIYNGKDTDYTFRLARSFRAQLKEDPKLARVFMRLMMPASRALTDIERVGVWLDPQRWEERRREAEEKRETLYRYIERWVPEPDRPINLNSPPQVGRFLFQTLGLPIIKTSEKSGNPSADKGVLLELAKQHQACKALIKWRKWNNKYLSTYLLPWWYEHRDLNGRVRSNYKLFGTVTGRLSGEGGIHQVPRDGTIRSVFGAEPGWTFVAADYSMIELRIAAMISNERNMLEQFRRGDDIHRLRAARITSKKPEDVTKEERARAKPVSFGFIYGMGEGNFVDYSFREYEIEFTEEEAADARNGFFADYPALKPWHDRYRRLARRYQQIRSPIGRIRHLPNVLSQDKDMVANAERQAINYPVQSLASDIMLMALVELHTKHLDKEKARIVGTVHDSILYEIKEGHEDEYLPVIKEVMEDMSVIKKNFGLDITVPIVVDVEVGSHWGEGEPWNAK